MNKFCCSIYEGFLGPYFLVVFQNIFWCITCFLWHSSANKFVLLCIQFVHYLFARLMSYCSMEREGKTKYLYTHVIPLQNSCSLVPSIITAIVSNIALVYCLVLILLGHKLETCCKQNKTLGNMIFQYILLTFITAVFHIILH